VAGREIVAAPAVEHVQVLSLMDALKKSVAEAKAEAQPAEAERPPKKVAPSTPGKAAARTPKRKTSCSWSSVGHMGLFDWLRRGKPSIPLPQLCCDVAYFVPPHYACVMLGIVLALFFPVCSIKYGRFGFGSRQTK
jgi:hypothetical protein